MILTKAAPIQAQRLLGQPAGLESYSGGESDVAVSVSATGLKGEAWHAYVTDSLDAREALPPEHVVQEPAFVLSHQLPRKVRRCRKAGWYLDLFA
eukprot:g23004.t1